MAVQSLQIAIVGSGPSGFYAAEALLESGKPVQVDMFEQLLTPFGLVRSGVAPDHFKIKSVTAVFDRIARVPNFAFYGNVTIGTQISIEALVENYHAVVIACGATADERLGIPGENLLGSYTVTEFVGWYNGHPNFRDCYFDLSQEVAVVIGQGNVAADVCRILAKPANELATSDIAEHALSALRQSRVREIHVIGRRGPAQAKFTTSELRELTKIMGCVATVDPRDLNLNVESDVEIADPKNENAAKNVALFRGIANTNDSPRSKVLRFRFLESPVTLNGDRHVESIRLIKNVLGGPPFSQSARPTAHMIDLSCGLVFRSIGYRGVRLPGVPFDERLGIIPNRDGRVFNGAALVPRLYVTGWIKRGPSGVIGTNRADSVATIEALLVDSPSFHAPSRSGYAGLADQLKLTNIRSVSFEDWLRIDAEEVASGRTRGKPREKFTRTEDMLAVLGGAP